MKNGKYILVIVLIILALTVSTIGISCSAPSSSTSQGTQEENGEEQQQESSISQEELEQIQEAIEEEETDTTDYTSVTAGAELYGYMPSYLCTDTDNYVKVTVTNNSDFTWRAKGENKVRLGYHFYGQDVDFVEYDKTARTALPENLEPGESMTLEVLINDITNPGTYVVQIDLVLEGNWWFSSKDVSMIEGKVYFNSCLDDRDFMDKYDE
jgi:hypothetical protein